MWSFAELLNGAVTYYSIAENPGNSAMVWTKTAKRASCPTNSVPPRIVCSKIPVGDQSDLEEISFMIGNRFHGRWIRLTYPRLTTSSILFLSLSLTLYLPPNHFTNSTISLKLTMVERWIRKRTEQNRGGQGRFCPRNICRSCGVYWSENVTIPHSSKNVARGTDG